MSLLSRLTALVIMSAASLTLAACRGLPLNVPMGSDPPERRVPGTTFGSPLDVLEGVLGATAL